MHAQQYEITLPAGYDMGIIRDRVARRGHLLDDWGGLGLKAYLIRERGLRGSPVNQYAPFYLWNTVDGMNSFLWGGGFQGVSDDFGRPSAEDGALCAAAAVDTSRWELVHFSLWERWERDTPKADGEVFEVLHLSAPGRDRLPRGRQW